MCRSCLSEFAFTGNGELTTCTKTTAFPMHEVNQVRGCWSKLLPPKRTVPCRLEIPMVLVSERSGVMGARRDDDDSCDDGER